MKAIVHAQATHLIAKCRMFFLMLLTLLYGLNNPATAQTFSNTSGIVSSSSLLPTAYPSVINVTGLNGNLASVTVGINGLTAAAPFGCNLLLVGPGGQKFVLLAGAGASQGNGISTSNVIFSDAAVSSVPGVLVSGTYKPTATAPTSLTFPSPAPAGPYNFPETTGTATFGSVFGGTNPNGTWNLYADNASNTLSISSWTLNFTIIPPLATTTTISSSNNPSFTAAPNNSVTFTATVNSTNSVSEGTVNFTDNGNPLNGGIAVAVSNGTATLTTTLTTEGANNISANYNGTTNFALSSGSLTQRVNNHTAVNGNSFCNNLSGITATSSATGIAASPYPSEMFVSGLTGTINSLTVSINGFQSNKPSSVELLLVGPGNQTLVLLTGYGGAGSNPYNLGNIVFSDAGVAVPGTLTSGGTYKPTAVDPGTLTAPAPAGPYSLPAPGGSASLASIFGGINPNGTWQLYEYDTYVGNSPTLISSWCLNFTLNTPVITSVTPNSGQQGATNLSVAIVGQNTHFAQGSTIAGFGAGIIVNSLTVNSAISATANISIDQAAALGSNDVTLTTGAEVAKLSSGFMITAGPPVISSVTVTPATCNNLSGASVVVNASGGAGPLQYSFDGGTTWQLGNTLSSSSTPAISLPATLSILVKDQNLQQVSYNANPVLIPVPTCCTNPSLSTINVCQNDLVTLTALATGESPGLTYQWYSSITNSNSNGTAIGSTQVYSANTTPGSTTVSNVNVSYVTTTQNFSPPETNAGTTYYYYYTVTGPGGAVTCNVAAQVNVNALPSANLTATTGFICSGSSPSLAVAVTVPGLMDNWTVVLSDGTTATGTGSGTVSVMAMPITGTTQYSITSLTDNTTGCTSIGSVVSGTPIVSIQSPNPVVTNNNDAGPGSLRQAMLNACPGSTITFDPTFFATPQVITLASDLPRIAQALTIAGPGANNLTLNGNNYALFLLTYPATNPIINVNISGLTISGVARLCVNNSGQGTNLNFSNCSFSNITSSSLIFSVGALNLTNCTFTNNLNPSYVGQGSIYVDGPLNVSGCTFSNNSENQQGEVIACYGGGTITNSTFTGNSAYQGGGIFVGGNSIANITTISNCTFYGNSASSQGGAIYVISNGSTSITNCTISGNTAAIGGGIAAYGGTLNVSNTISAGNSSATSPDVYVAVAPFTPQLTSLGNNLIGKTDGSNGWIGTDLTGTLGSPLNALLDPNGLANNGGSTQTIALLPGSPAINAGTSNGALSTDQRGLGRVGAVDIGAFESQGFTLSTVSGSTPQNSIVNQAFTNPLSVTVTANNSIEPVDGGKVSFMINPAQNGATCTLTGTSPVTIAGGVASLGTATANSTAGTYRVTASATGVSAASSFNLTNQNPVITVIGSVTAFTSCSGTASVAQTITVSGAGLLNNLAVTAPTGFEISLDGNIYSANLSLAPISGNVATTMIYVRMASTASGTSAGSVAFTSTPASEQDVAVTGTVNPLPAIMGEKGTALSCAGGIATLTVASNASSPTYNWYSDAAGQNLLQSSSTASFTTPALTTNTTYYVSVTDGITNCLSSSLALVTVTVNPLPIIKGVSGTTTICSGTTTMLTASSNATSPTYNWYGSSTGGTILYTGATFTTPPINANTTYYVSVIEGTSSCASSNLTTTTVTVNALPSAKISATGTPVCLNGTSPSVTFTGSGSTAPYTYLYSINNVVQAPITDIGTGSITIQIPSNISGTFVYTLTSVQDASSTQCSTTISGQSASVTINPLPTATISGTAAVCQNTPSPNVTLSGLGGTAPYTFGYSLNYGGTTTTLTVTGNPAIVTVPTTTAGIYTYTLTNVQDANSCPQAVASASVQVTVNPLPSASISTASMVTAISTGNIASVDNAGTGATYVWTITNGTITAGAGTNKITYTAGATGNMTLSVSVTSPNSCGPVNSTTPLIIPITALPCPNPAITSPWVVCAASTGNTASVAKVLGNKYVWTISNGTITAGAGTNSISYAAGADDFVTLSVTVTNASGQCTVSSGKYYVVISPLPSAAITTNASVCTNSKGNIAYVPGCGIGSNYTWSITNGTITAGSGTSKITYTAGTSGTVILGVSVTNAAGCKAASGSKSVTISAYPIASISAAASVCASSSGNAASVASAGTGARYAWSISNGGITSGEGTSSITFTATKSGSVILSVTVTNSSGCSTASGNKTLSIAAAPSASITTASSACAGSIGNIATVGSINGGTYIWTLSSGATITSGSGTNSIKYTAPSSGTSLTISVTVTNSSGCKTSSGIMKVAIAAKSIPTFTSIPTLCIGSKAPVLPTTSNNGISGSWKPSTVSTASAGTANYVFTPSSVNCASAVTVSVTVHSCTQPAARVNAATVIPAVNEDVEGRSIRMYPNPFVASFSLELRSNKTEKIEIRVMDVMGHVLHQVSGEATGTYKFGEHLIKGMYFVQVLYPDGARVLKVIKQ